MRLVRFRLPGDERARSGKLVGDAVRSGGEEFPLDGVRLLAPCVPTKIVCVGRNYAAHAEEMGGDVPERPLLFFKPPSAVIGPEDEIVLPAGADVHHEAELAVVIGVRCRDVAADRAGDVILGYTCANDVTDRTAQAWEKNWVRAKGFDTSAPLGPWIVPRDEIEEPFHVSLKLNGEIRQDGWTSAMIFPIGRLIETISAIMTLEPGDVIATGTPAGVGVLAPGDVVEVVVDGVGTLRNVVRS
jgi:2-keto-4-pentenoate hydratase/2-oxohepta-3-ene-1,7-dioic acid hydratase in catechol pathway